MAKRITQQTFDDVVQENIHDFDMTVDAAIEDAIQQFQSQVSTNVYHSRIKAHHMRTFPSIHLFLHTYPFM